MFIQIIAPLLLFDGTLYLFVRKFVFKLIKPLCMLLNYNFTVFIFACVDKSVFIVIK